MSNSSAVDKIVATLDTKTSEICRELDGKVLDMKDYAPGITSPPFHPWCRTVTVPYFEDNYTERAARDYKGKTYYVPSDMTYKKWYNEYVVPNELPKTMKLGIDLSLKEQIRYKKEDGRFGFIPLETKIIDTTVIAGEGVSKKLYDIERLTSSYGGRVEDWQKCAGKIESNNYVFDVHWYLKKDAVFEQKITKKVKKK